MFLALRAREITAADSRGRERLVACNRGLKAELQASVFPTDGKINRRSGAPESLINSHPGARQLKNSTSPHRLFAESRESNVIVRLLVHSRSLAYIIPT